jgi:hypothetical protein
MPRLPAYATALSPAEIDIVAAEDMQRRVLRCVSLYLGPRTACGDGHVRIIVVCADMLSLRVRLLEFGTYLGPRAACGDGHVRIIIVCADTLSLRARRPELLLPGRSYAAVIFSVSKGARANTAKQRATDENQSRFLRFHEVLQ